MIFSHPLSLCLSPRPSPPPWRWSKLCYSYWSPGMNHLLSTTTRLKRTSMCLKDKRSNFVSGSKSVSQIASINLYQNQKIWFIREPLPVNTSTPLFASNQGFYVAYGWREEKRVSGVSILRLRLHRYASCSSLHSARHPVDTWHS